MTSDNLDFASQVKELFRSILILAVDRSTASELIGEDCRELWASEVYTSLTQAMLANELTWARSRDLLDHIFYEEFQSNISLSPLEAAQRFQAQKDYSSLMELASYAWALLRKREPAIAPLLARVGQELQLVAIERAREYPLPQGSISSPKITSILH